MNTTQLQYIKQTLRECLEYVRHSTHESDGLAKGQTIRQIQKAQSLIGNELAPVLEWNSTLHYVEGATYLFVINHEPKFTLDDWPCADTTYNYLRRQGGYHDLRVIPVVDNPADDNAIDALLR